MATKSPGKRAFPPLYSGGRPPFPCHSKHPFPCHFERSREISSVMTDNLYLPLLRRDTVFITLSAPSPDQTERKGALSLRFREGPLFHAPAPSSLQTVTAPHSGTYIHSAGRSPEKTCHLPGLLSQTIGIQLLPTQRMEGGEEATTSVRTSRKKRAGAARKEAPNRTQTDKQPFGKKGLAIETR